ncbi:MAG: hypothetical protein B6D35_06805, partial [Candidatus Brocadia sp. UTAMX2]
ILPSTRPSIYILSKISKYLFSDTNPNKPCKVGFHASTQPAARTKAQRFKAYLQEHHIIYQPMVFNPEGMSLL